MQSLNTGTAAAKRAYGSYLTNKPLWINFSAIRDNLIIILICLYFVLNYGFIHIRGPFGIPVGEIILVFSLLTINHRVILPKFLAHGVAIPLILWWVFGIARSLSAVPEYGFWAIRDASHVIESLFLYIGFAFAGNLAAIEKLKVWFPRTMFVCVLYSLTYPFHESLKAYSPIVKGPQGHDVPLLFKYTNTVNVMVIYLAFLIQTFLQNNRKKFLYGAVVVLTLALLLLPSRTLYLELMILLTFFAAWLGRKNLLKLAPILILPFLLLALILASGIPVEGRFGAGLTIADYGQVFLEMLPGYQAETMYTSGTAERFEWWISVFQQWSQSFTSMLFGLGYGFPLIDFQLKGAIVVREPHNDLISILARGGILGLSLFIAFQAVILKTAFRLASTLKNNLDYGAIVVLLLFILLTTWANVIGEPPFVLPFYAIPYYFAAGIILRLYRKRNTL